MTDKETKQRRDPALTKPEMEDIKRLITVQRKRLSHL
jgi:hypothetical protein